jgi:ROS/MUCR transcriptional regulator protein
VSAVGFAARAEAPGRQSTPAAHPCDWLDSLRADPRQAIQEDAICCLICGRAFRQLTNTHLRAHGSVAGEYKRLFGYNRGRPLMCYALQRLYATRAVQSGLAARIRSRPILAKPELRRLGGARAIALEELLTRREARRKAEGTGNYRSSASLGRGDASARSLPAPWRLSMARSPARA